MSLIRLRKLQYDDRKNLLNEIAEKCAAGVYGSTPAEKTSGTLRAISNLASPLEHYLSKFITADPLMIQTKARLRLIQQRPEPVLITGPTGTGKELLARALTIAGQPFVAENCAALPENLIESIFFGHRKGAFTGANEDHKGLLEEAGQGIIFLDEIGDLSLTLQAKFLRAIQEGEIRRVGSTEIIALDCRFVAATKYDLEKLVEEKRFREDLFARLFTFHLSVTGLKERPDDIDLIAKSMINKPDGFGRGEPSSTEPDNMPPFDEKVMTSINKYNVRAIEAALARWRAYGSYL